MTPFFLLGPNFCKIPRFWGTNILGTVGLILKTV